MVAIIWKEILKSSKLNHFQKRLISQENKNQEQKENQKYQESNKKKKYLKLQESLKSKKITMLKEVISLQEEHQEVHQEEEEASQEMPIQVIVKSLVIIKEEFISPKIIMITQFM